MQSAFNIDPMDERKSSSLARFNVFDWLGLYKPLLREWGRQDLKIERVDFGGACPDPVTHRIQVSYYSAKWDRRIYGLGEADQETLAYEKAICELIERQAMFEQGKRFGVTSTNGLAAHRLQYLAKEMAKLELLERDAFLRHWLTRIPMKPIPVPDDTATLKFVAAFDASDHDLVLCDTYLGAVPSTIAVVVNRRTKGFVIGSSAKKDAAARARKAIGESYLVLFGKDRQSVNWGKPDFMDHSNYWYYQQQIPSWFCADAVPPSLPKIPKPKFYYHILQSKPVPVVAANSNQLINIWVGPTPKPVIEHITEFYSVPVNTDPHPFP